MGYDYTFTFPKGSMVYRTNGTLLLKLSFVRDRVYVTLEVGLLSFPTPLTTISLPFIDAMPRNSISLPKYDKADTSASASEETSAEASAEAEEEK